MNAMIHRTIIWKVLYLLGKLGAVNELFLSVRHGWLERLKWVESLESDQIRFQAVQVKEMLERMRGANAIKQGKSGSTVHVLISNGYQHISCVCVAEPLYKYTQCIKKKREGRCRASNVEQSERHPSQPSLSFSVGLPTFARERAPLFISWLNSVNGW